MSDQTKVMVLGVIAVVLGVGLVLVLQHACTH